MSRLKEFTELLNVSLEELDGVVDASVREEEEEEEGL